VHHLAEWFSGTNTSGSIAESKFFYCPQWIASNDNWGLGKLMGGVPVIGYPFSFFDRIEQQSIRYQNYVLVMGNQLQLINGVVRWSDHHRHKKHCFFTWDPPPHFNFGPVGLPVSDPRVLHSITYCECWMMCWNIKLMMKEGSGWIHFGKPHCWHTKLQTILLKGKVLGFFISGIL
jgi:hypothetical protein